MPTELPTQRLHRRLGAEPGPTTEAESTVDDDDGSADTLLSRWLPEPKSAGPAGWVAAARADPGRAGVIALAVVGVIAVLVTVFTLVRDKTPAVVSANLPPVQMVSSTPSSGAPKLDQPVVVSVVGLVHKPGLVTLAPDARIADALTASGGPVDGADLVGLNMARRVADGEQIVVGLAAPPGEPPGMGSSVSSVPGTATAAPMTHENAPAPGTSIDLNAATAEQLETLPGIGPVTAAAIVAWRDANGRFDSVDQLGDVDGIGPARLEKLRALVHV